MVLFIYVFYGNLVYKFWSLINGMATYKNIPLKNKRWWTVEISEISTKVRLILSFYRKKKVTFESEHAHLYIFLKFLKNFFFCVLFSSF